MVMSVFCRVNSLTDRFGKVNEVIKTSCRSSKKSCLKRVILVTSETLLKPQNSRRGFE